MLRFAVLFFLASSAAAAQDKNPKQNPTFYADVLPLLQKHCQTCHRPGEIGPMPLLDYKEVRPWAAAIRQVVIERQMPPWFADPRYGRFSNDRSLSEADIRTISNWVSAGAPAGDPAWAPRSVQWIEGWSIGKPEIVLTMPMPFNIPASGVLPYQYVIVPTHFQKDTWVRPAEVRAADRKHTHHIVVSIREPGSNWLAEYPVGKPFSLRPDLPTGGPPGAFLAGYGPGALPETLAPGQAKLIKAGSDLIFQLHYTTDGIDGCDQSRVGLVLSLNNPRERVLMLAAANVGFAIPPGKDDYKVDASVILPRNATLVSLLPHMHLRGKSFEFRAVYPGGQTKTLLKVPHYSYNWQLSYYLAPQLPLPAGTRIECTAHFDNSANNPLNPDPTKLVRFGPQSWDEMMIGYFEVAIPTK